MIKPQKANVISSRINGKQVWRTWRSSWRFLRRISKPAKSTNGPKARRALHRSTVPTGREALGCLTCAVPAKDKPEPPRLRSMGTPLSRLPAAPQKAVPSHPLPCPAASATPHLATTGGISAARQRRGSMAPPPRHPAPPAAQNTRPHPRLSSSSIASQRRRATPRAWVNWASTGTTCPSSGFSYRGRRVC